MTIAGMLARLVVSLAAIGWVAWQSPATIGIALFIAMLAFQAMLVARAWLRLQARTGPAFQRAARRLAIEVAAGIAVNACAFFGSMWASSVYG